MSADSLGSADRDAWSRLADRAAEANPFFRAEFVLAAVEERGEGAVLLVAAEGDDWVACLVLHRARRWRRVPLPCLVPWLPDYAYLAAPLIDRDRIGSATAAVARFLAGQRRTAALVLNPLDRAGPVGSALAAALHSHGLSAIVYADFERAALRRRPESTYLAEALSGKGRKELRRLRRGLAEATGGPVATRDRSLEPAACEDFLELERRSWKGEIGTALASRRGDAAFFRRIWRTMASEGRLQLLALEAGGRTVAMQCNLVDGNALFGFKVAYDRTFARFSPGALLEVDAIDVFHDRLPTTTFVDSCAAPDNHLLNRLWPDRRCLQTVVVPTGARLGGLVRPGVRADALSRRLLAARQRQPGARR